MAQWAVKAIVMIGSCRGCLRSTAVTQPGVVFSAECYYCYHLQRRYRGGGEQVTECPNNEPYTIAPAPHQRICMRFEQSM